MKLYSFVKKSLPGFIFPHDPLKMDAYYDGPISWHLAQVDMIKQLIWLLDALVLGVIFWVIYSQITYTSSILFQ